MADSPLLCASQSSGHGPLTVKLIFHQKTFNANKIDTNTMKCTWPMRIQPSFTQRSLCSSGSRWVHAFLLFLNFLFSFTSFSQPHFCNNIQSQQFNSFPKKVMRHSDKKQVYVYRTMGHFLTLLNTPFFHTQPQLLEQCFVTSSYVA